MNRLARLRHDVLLTLRGWRAQRRLRAETLVDLIGTVNDLTEQITELRAELDEVRADSRRVAELRIQVEDFLADHP
ncbi:hypothetical protein ACFWHT_05175 [Microbacterium sp. NPDC058342]|uniref:hypothetical protein n=1 Tax=Microbacterium sp. NPDC058342 TaxID=3346454 RepID=UPI00365CB069